MISKTTTKLGYMAGSSSLIPAIEELAIGDSDAGNSVMARFEA